jgi:hypothetical protein
LHRDDAQQASLQLNSAVVSTSHRNDEDGRGMEGCFVILAR